MMILKLSLTKIIFLVFLLLLLFSTSQCNTGNDSELENQPVGKEEDYFNFQSVNLQPHEISALIMVPDETAGIGATTLPEVIHKENDFKWKLIVGPNFGLIIEDYGEYDQLIRDMKNRLKEEKMFRIQYLTDEPDLLVYKRTLIVRGVKNASPKVGVEHSSFHVYAVRSIHGINYELRSNDEGSSKKLVELMVKSIRSFKELKLS
jgi:hypothetical protein